MFNHISVKTNDSSKEMLREKLRTLRTTHQHQSDPLYLDMPDGEDERHRTEIEIDSIERKLDMLDRYAQKRLFIDRYQILTKTSSREEITSVVSDYLQSLPTDTIRNRKEWAEELQSCQLAYDLSDEEIAEISSNILKKELPKEEGFDGIDINMEIEDQRYVIPDLVIGPGRPSIIYGAPDSAKTTLTLYLALHLSAGVAPFPGWHPARGSAIWLDFDGMGKHELARKLKRMLPTTQQTKIDNISVKCVEGWNLDTISAEQKIETMIKGKSLCVIDSLRGASDGDENDNRSHPKILYMLGRVSERTGCAIIVIHHSTKANPEELRGGGSILGAANTALYVRREGNSMDNFIYRVRQRKFAIGQFAPFDFRLVDEGDTREILRIEKLSADSKYEDPIILILTDGMPRSATQIATELGNKNRKIKHLLDDLLLTNKIKMTKIKGIEQYSINSALDGENIKSK